jgi:ABC-type antimicrobial peptide transport system permease subunit
MNKHILKLIWNRRKEFVWIFVEQVLVFAVMFYCLSEVYSRLDNFFNPGNLNLKNVCSVAIIPNPQAMVSDEMHEEYREKYNYLMERTENSSYIETVHKGYYTIPGNRQSWNNKRDSLNYKGNKYQFYIKTSDGNFQKVFNVKMLEGTWYKDEALADGTYPAVLTKSLVGELDLTNPLGTKLNYKGHDFTITGVMNDYKSFLFDNPMPSAIFANSALVDNDESISNRLEIAMLVKKGQMADFANYFWQEAEKTFPNQGHQFIISDLGKSSQGEMFEVLVMILLIAVIPTLFLAIFAFLGTFSLMYRLSQKYFGEYGLRMALGSTKGSLRSMVLRQSIFISALATCIGCIIGLNLYIFVFPEISFQIIIGAALSTFILMIVFSIVSVLYPAQKASKTQPAIALKQEV